MISMKWFFALNQDSSRFEQYSIMSKAAVLSAQQYTDLEAIFLFEGTSVDLMQWMQAHQVTIIQMKSSLYDELRNLNASSGVFLRVDIPWIMNAVGWNDAYVLYTDCDILFQNPIDLNHIHPKYFAAAPEIVITDFYNMNSGVMLMNIENLQRTFNNFHAFIKRYLHYFVKQDGDQTAYRCYYYMEWEQLMPKYNWKPYWGENANASIIHFHGPKPTELEDIKRASLDPIRQGLVCDTFYQLTEIWQDYAQAAQNSTSIMHNRKQGEIISLDLTYQQVFEKVKFYGKEDQLDALRNLIIQKSEYRKYCDADQPCDWRAVKGTWALWIMFHRDIIEEQLAFSELFRILDQPYNEYVHLVIAYRIAPQAIEVQKRIGANLARRHKLDDARLIFESALQISPNEGDIWVSLAKVFFDLGNIPDAQRCLQQALIINPEDEDAQLGLEVIKVKKPT